MAIRIDRVYTRTGDAGDTGLAGGDRIAKEAPRIEAFGCVDELNSFLGIVAEELRALPPGAGRDLRGELEGAITRTQQKLFDLGAYLATPPARYRAGMPSVGNEEISRLESEMDRWQERLEPLRSFVLPGGGRIGALLHAARTVCRRAERETIRLHRLEPLGEPAIPYLNRLSDWLFTAARIAAKLAGSPEVLWTPARPSSPASPPDPPRPQ